MSGDMAIQVGREALFHVLIVSAPILGLGLVVGLMVSIFQATTHIQEQTLVFIPKIVAVFVAISFFGPWMLNIMMSYLSRHLTNIPMIIK